MLADGAPVIVSDSYFDLRAGEFKTIRLESTAPISTEELLPAHWLTEWI